MMWPCTVTSSPARSLRISCGSVIGNVTVWLAIAQNSRSKSMEPSAAMCAEARRAAQHW